MVKPASKGSGAVTGASRGIVAAIASSCAARTESDRTRDDDECVAKVALALAALRLPGATRRDDVAAADR